MLNGMKSKHVDPTKSGEASPSPLWKQLNRLENKYLPEELPKVSIVIPTRNAAQVIGSTLDSVLAQDYPDFEVIIVDSSEDRTLEVVKNYHSERVQVYSVSHCTRYEMLNKGLSQANGEYVNFLFPGDFYIYRETLKHMMGLALENQEPQLVYCGTLLRDALEEVKILYRPLTIDLLRKGQQPTSLQSCWFHVHTLCEIGKFDPSFRLRGGFELLCRFCTNKKLRFVATKRVFTDYDLRIVRRRMILIHFWETMKTVFRYFGLLDTVRWVLVQKDWVRFLKLWVHNLKVAFAGRS